MDSIMLIYTQMPSENAEMPISYCIDNTLYVTHNFFEVLERVSLHDADTLVPDIKAIPYVHKKRSPKDKTCSC